MREQRARGIGFTSQRTRDRMVAGLRKKGISDETVLAAMAAVPRHLFVDEALASRAYEDVALPIGFEQTISRPYVVAFMLQEMRGGRTLARVLEVGTGCGYQAALLAAIAREAYSVERIAGLLEKARANLRPLRIPNLRLAYGDGRLGLPEAGPFDGIVIAAATAQLPEPLLQQLGVGGRMVAPLGAADQALCLVERTARGFSETRLDAVRFVPMRAGKQ